MMNWGEQRSNATKARYALFFVLCCSLPLVAQKASVSYAATISYDAFWTTQWHSAALAFTADVAYKGYFLGMGAGWGHPHPAAPLVVALFSSTSSEKDLTIDDSVVTVTGRAGVLVPYTDRLSLKLIAETGYVANSFGAGAGFTIAYNRERDIGFFMGYSLFYKPKTTIMHRAALGFHAFYE